MDIRELLRNKKIITVITIFVAISIAVIIMSIIVNLQRKSNLEASVPKVEVDPASGQKITSFTGYKPKNGDGVLWIGFPELIDKGISRSTEESIKKIFRDYMKYDKKETLERVSLYKDSFRSGKTEDRMIFHTMKFAINTNKEDIFLRVLLKGFENYTIELYSDDKMTNKIKELSYCSVLICPVEEKPNNIEPPIQGHNNN